MTDEQVDDGRPSGLSSDDGAAIASPPKASIPDAVRVGVTGTQDGLTEAQQEAARMVFKGLHAGGAEWQHNGDCIGADSFAAHFWHALGGKVHLHPPSYNGKRVFFAADSHSAPRPYMDRNTDIAKAGDVLVAMPKEFQEELRSGTWATVRRARRMRKPIIYVWPDGRTTVEWPAQAIEARSGETPQEHGSRPLSA